ncbi:MAG: hypothetical protein V3U92_05110 [Cellulophaga sp.]
MKQLIFGLKKTLLTSFMTSLIFLSCKDAKPQVYADSEQAVEKRVKSNFEQYLLGASKFCIDEDYQSYFGEYRDMTHLGMVSKRGNCCTAIVNAPFVNPYEQYLYMFDDEDGIVKNMANPFELKKIRENLKSKIAQVKKKIEKVNPKNLTYRMVSNIEKYDFNSNQLMVRGLGKNIAMNLNKPSTSLVMIDVENVSYTYGIPLSPKKAEEVFSYYGGNETYRKRPVNCQITYQLVKSKTYSKRFAAIISKVEVFHPEGWRKKIGEITF